MCTCKNMHSEKDYEFENKIIAALEKRMIAAEVRPLIVKRNLRLMRAELANLDEIAKST